MQFGSNPRAWRLVSVAAILTLLFSQVSGAGQPVDHSWSGAFDVPELCFAPGTPDRQVEFTRLRAEQFFARNSLSVPTATKHQIANRWTYTATDGSVSRGEPTTLTWSVVPDGTPISSGIGEPAASSSLRSFLNGIYGSEVAWLAVMQQVFDRWSSLNGITYVYEPNDDGSAINGGSAAGSVGVRGDVRISGHPIDGDYGVLAFNYYPNNGDMVIDTNDSFYGNISSDSLGFRNVFAHEHGHGLGLAHSCPIVQTKLMEPFVSFAFDGPQHDDILATNRSYGDRYEYNETSGAAEALGAFGSLTVSNLSVDDNSDVDVYSLVADPGVELDLTLTPVGATYLSGPQVGACDTGSSYNSLTIQDLAVRVLDTNGSSELASADDNGVGASESLTGVSLETGGTYYVEVTGDSSDEAQLYELSLTVSPSDQLFSDGFESNSTSGWSDSVP